MVEALCTGGRCLGASAGTLALSGPPGTFLRSLHLAESVCLRAHASLKQELKYNFLLVKNCPGEA